MDDVNYMQADVKQCRSGLVDSHELFSAVLPGVHEIIPHQNHPSMTSWDSNHNKLVRSNSQPAYAQTLYPNVQDQNTVTISSQVYSHTNRHAYQSEHLFYPPDRGLQFPFAYPLRGQHDVNHSWSNTRFLQSPLVNDVESSQWMSNSSTSSKLPGTGYGSGPGGSYSLINTYQTCVLGPIQQPKVQPTPPCFWVDRFKSQSLRPLPRPVCSTLGIDIKPQIHHAGCYSPSELRVCPEYSVNNQAAPTNNNTIQSDSYGQSSYKNSLLYSVPGVNKASVVASKYPQYETASHFGHVPSATVSFGNLASYPSDCTNRSVNKNVGFVHKNNLQICHDEQKRMLDENCNHVYQAPMQLHPRTGEGVNDKCDDEPEVSLDEDDLSSSLIEEYIQSAPDFHSLSQIQLDQSSVSQIHLDKSELVSKTDQSASRRVSKSETIVKDTKVVVSPQTEVIQSQGSDVTKGSTLDNLDIMTKGKGNLFYKDLATLACSSSSSEVSPITTNSKSNMQSSTRRRSYRSRKFSKEFCNRWSSFEDVPLVISGKPKYQIVCSTPKKVNIGDSTLLKKKYKCEICSKRFFNHYTYSRHFKQHKTDAENRHQNQTPSKNVYRCSACNMTWFNRDLFISHSQYHMNKMKQSSYTGDDLAFKVDTTEPGSFSKDKEQSFVQSSHQRYVCSICKDSFSSSYEYNIHCAKHQKTDGDIVSSNESDSSTSSPIYFSCSVCDMKFVNRFMYSKHCVSKEHKIMQKHRETALQKSERSEIIVHERPEVLKSDVCINLKPFSNGNPRSLGIGEQSNLVLKHLDKDVTGNYWLGAQKKPADSEMVKNESFPRKDVGKVKSLKCGCPSVSTISKVKRQLHGFTSDKVKTDGSHSGIINQNHFANSCPYCMVMKQPLLRGALDSSNKLTAVVESLDEKSKLISCLVGKHFSKPTQPRQLFQSHVQCCYGDSACSVITEKLSQITLSSEHLSNCRNDETFSKHKELKSQVDANNNVTDVATKYLHEMDVPLLSSCNGTLVKTGGSSFHGLYKPSDISSNLAVGTTGSSEGVKNSTEQSILTNDFTSAVDNLSHFHGNNDMSIIKKLPLSTSDSSCFYDNKDLLVTTKSFTSVRRSSSAGLHARNVCETVKNYITVPRKYVVLTDNSHVKEKKPANPLKIVMEDRNISTVDCHDGGHIVLEGKKKRLELKSEKKSIAVKHVIPIKHGVPVPSDKKLESNKKLQKMTHSSTLVSEDVSKMQTAHQFEFVENKLQTNACMSQTNDSGLETTTAVFNEDKLQDNSVNNNDESNSDKTASSWQNDTTKLDINKRNVLDIPEFKIYSSKIGHTKCVDLHSSEDWSDKTEQEDGDVLKGDSGLWSDDEVLTGESDKEGNVLHSNRVKDNVCLNNRVEGNVLHRNTEDGPKDNAGTSEVWNIKIVDSSDKDCKSDLENCSLLSTEQMGVASKKTIVAFEVEYDGCSNSVDLGESRKQVAKNNWKIISDFVNLSNDSVPQIHLTPSDKPNLQNDANDNKMANQEVEVSKDGKIVHDLVCRSSLPLFQHHSRRKNMLNTALLFDVYDNGKTYFCEICGETFLNPFRYSAHYKKKSHVELASHFSYETISYSKTLPKKKKEKVQKLGKTFEIVKNLKSNKKTIVEKRIRKQLSNTNVSFDFGAGIVQSSRRKLKMKNPDYHLFKNSPVDHRKKPNAFKSQLGLKNKVAVKNMQHEKMSQNGSKGLNISGKLKKIASSNRLKRLKSTLNKYVSKPIQNLPRRNHLSEINPITSITKKSYLEKKPIVCSCCSCLFVTNKDFRLHMCPKKYKRQISLDKSQGSGKMAGCSEKQFGETDDGLKNLDKDRDLLKVTEKVSVGLKSGLHYEPQLKKRKPVVKCPALLKLLTATEEEFKKEYSGLRRPLNVHECVPCKLKCSSSRSHKRHHSCTQHKKCSQKRSSSHVKMSGSDLLKPVEQLVKHGEIVQPSTSSTDQTESTRHAKKLKLSSILPNHAQKGCSRRKLGACVKKNHQTKAVKKRTVEWDVYCDVCEKTYSSKSHLYRHFGTKVHKQHLLEKNDQKKLK